MIPTHKETPRLFQRMLSGRMVHLLDPSPLDIDIAGDFLMAISREPRWNGQTVGDEAYRVAQHCVLEERVLVERVWRNAPRQVRLYVLIHDLAEALLKDLPSPLKAAIKAHGYGEVEERLDRAIRIRVGLPVTLPQEWEDARKRAERILVVSEAVRLGCWSEKDARRDVGAGFRGRLWDGEMIAWSEARCREEWRRKYLFLGGAL
jgi:uncharacterized protein